MNNTFGLLLAILLIAANAFFVAAEFSLISARRDRLEALAEQGKVRAVTVIHAGEQLSSMLAGSQLGVTVASLLLGRVGESALDHGSMHGTAILRTPPPRPRPPSPTARQSTRMSPKVGPPAQGAVGGPDGPPQRAAAGSPQAPFNRSIRTRMDSDLPRFFAHEDG